MNILRKAFLYVVGAIAIAYEETSKVIDEQRARLDRNTSKA